MMVVPGPEPSAGGPTRTLLASHTARSSTHARRLEPSYWLLGTLVCCGLLVALDAAGTAARDTARRQRSDHAAKAIASRAGQFAPEQQALWTPEPLARSRPETPPSVLRLRGPKPPAVLPPSAQQIERAIRRGVEFLLETQNPDGSWGSFRSSRPYNVLAPVPGAHHGFRAATTSLCISALIEVGDDDPQVQAALDRAEKWMFERLPHVRRATPEVFYNTWAHAFSIQALVRMHGRRAGHAEAQQRIRRLIAQQMDMLRRYEVVDGGWAYYDFEAHTKKPSGSSISFVTATVLVALDEARKIGCPVPQKEVERGVASILRQRKPDYSYCYGEYLKYTPTHPVNLPGGSLGRSQACNVALRRWGDRSVTDEVLKVWLDRIFARNMWLDIGRKRPIPHESWFQVAGYFFYYGHYYAALCIEQLPARERPFYQAHLARVLVRLQEDDGSWWDFPMYDYHQQYGTAFALMALGRCEGLTERSPAASGKPTQVQAPGE